MYTLSCGPGKETNWDMTVVVHQKRKKDGKEERKVIYDTNEKRENEMKLIDIKEKEHRMCFLVFLLNCD